MKFLFIIFLSYYLTSIPVCLGQILPNNLLSINDDLSRFLYLEQVVITEAVTDQKKWRSYLLKENEAIVKPYLGELAKKYKLSTAGIDRSVLGELIVTDTPTQFNYLKSNYNEQIEYTPEIDFIKSKLIILPEQEKCIELKKIYLYIIWKVSAIKPSFQYEEINDLLVYYYGDTLVSNAETAQENEKLHKYLEELRLYQFDKNKVAWEFRYDELFMNISSCMLTDSLELPTEYFKRKKYIAGDDPLQRKPLGFAIGMCGRSMQGHYVDDEIDMNLRRNCWIDGIKSYEKLIGKKINFE